VLNALGLAPSGAALQPKTNGSKIAPADLLYELAHRASGDIVATGVQFGAKVTPQRLLGYSHSRGNTRL
jgi:hypothetical protein